MCQMNRAIPTRATTAGNQAKLPTKMMRLEENTAMKKSPRTSTWAWVVSSAGTVLTMTGMVSTRMSATRNMAVHEM